MADRQLIRPLDVPALRAQYARAEPFRYFVIEGLFEPSFAAEVASAEPTVETATQMGLAFRTVNERQKVLQTAKRRVRRLCGRAIGRR